MTEDQSTAQPPKKSRASKIWGIVILVLGCLLSLGVLGSIGSGQMAQARAEMGDDTVAQFTYTFFNLAVFLLIPLGIWLLVRRPKR